MTKRILIIGRYFPPLDSIASLRLYSWAKHFRDRGAEVTILTTSKEKQVMVPLDVDTRGIEILELPYFDPITRLTGEKKQVLAAAKGGGLKAWASRLYRVRMNERMPGRTDPWILPARRQILEWKRAGRRFDVAISSYGPPSAHIVGAFARKHVVDHWVADYRDLWIENASYKGLWPFTSLEKWIEKRCVGKADAITTISDPYRDFLQSKFPHVPVSTVTNGYAPELIDAYDAGYYDDRPSSFRIVYTGAIYPQTRDPSPLFRALRTLIDEKKVQKDQVEVLFYGGVADGLEELIAEHGLEGTVRHEGCLSQGDAYRVQKSAQALLFLEDPKPKVEGVLTGKLFEYLYMNAPILAVGVGERSAAGALIEQANAGVVAGQDSNCIAETLERWIDQRQTPKRDAAVVAQYSRGACADTLWKVMEALG